MKKLLLAVGIIALATPAHAQLYSNSSTSQIGIGTTSPANSLDITTGQGVHIGDGTPTSTSNALYSVSGQLQWNGAPVGGSGYDVYADPNTQLLMHMENNANDSSIFGNTFTNSGVTFSTSIYKLGSYSAYFNGTSSSGDTLTSASNILTSNAMTVDYFVYFSGNIPYKGSNTNYEETLFTIGLSNTAGQMNVTSGTTSSVPNTIQVEWGTATDPIVVAYPFSLNTWYHIALEVIGSKCYLWVNGTQVASGSSNVAVPPSAPLYLGTIPLAGYYDYFQGYIDEFRISNAVRYQPGVSFTPPTAPYNPGPIQ